MTRTLSQSEHESLINDLIDARLDLVSLANKYNLHQSDLARWMHTEENRQCLASLVMLADFQTQLLVSRYRAIAADKLIAMASSGEEKELVRKACIDLLHLSVQKFEPAGPEAGDDQLTVEAMSRLWYGEETPEERSGEEDDSGGEGQASGGEGR